VRRGVVAPGRAEAGAPLVLALGLSVTVVPVAACCFCASGMDADSPRRPTTGMAVNLLLETSRALWLGLHPSPRRASSTPSSAVAALPPPRLLLFLTVPSDTPQVSGLIPWYQGLIPRYHPVSWVPSIRYRSILSWYQRYQVPSGTRYQVPGTRGAHMDREKEKGESLKIFRCNGGLAALDDKT
jgi:hypothetical protein